LKKENITQTACSSPTIYCTLETLFAYCTHKGFSFVSYQLPRKTFSQTLVSFKEAIDVSLDTSWTSQKGFIIAPFQNSKNFSPYFIQPDLILEGDVFELEVAKLPKDFEVFIENPSSLSPDKKISFSVANKTAYCQLVEDIKTEIESTTLEKAIASRIYTHPKSPSFNPVHLLKKLNQKYSLAFTYLLNVPKVGCWLGASPEVLVERKNDMFRTVALAGTQKNDGNTPIQSVTWQSKETTEQAFVSQHIKTAIQPFIESCSFLVSDNETVAAGNLWHLQTQFLFHLKQNENFPKLIDALHPTPAVGGLPQQEAIDFILEKEQHQRSYYTGFLGPVNIEKSHANLFVNLRCMQVTKECLAFYTGAGITLDSVAEKEWEETENKVMTLLGVLGNGEL